MEWKKLVIFFSIYFCSNSCCIPLIQKKYYTTEFGSERPIKNNFKLAKSPYKLKNTDAILTNAVYIKTESSYFKSAITNENILLRSNSFFRFFPNGQYLYGSTKMDFSEGINDYNNLKSGIIGYYKIEDNRLILEMFLVTPHDCGKYSTSEFKIIEGNFADYKKLKIDGLTGTPDW